MLVPLFSLAITFGNLVDIEAMQASGTFTQKYGSKTGICGLQLCKDIPGGKQAWQSEEESPAGAPPMSPSILTTEDIVKTEPSPTTLDADSILKLSRANVPATIPMHQGYFDGEDVFYIITDSSDPTHAEMITKNQGWKVELSPPLAFTPKEALSKTYIFTNGVDGDGVHGFQGDVFTSTPNYSEKYSALTEHIHVEWTGDSEPVVMTSEQEILEAEKRGELVLTPSKIVLNMPQIVWPGGQMLVKEDKTLTDDMPYGGGQVLEIDVENKKVTFIAHRGWGPDGRTIYYIVTDATPSGPAEMMGVVNSPTSAKLIANRAAVDLFQFANGIKGSGPLGFQPGIASGALGDENYSPMWRINVISWKDSSKATLLETMGDIAAMKESGLLSVGLARPMDSDHIVNCPFIDPFQ